MGEFHGGKEMKGINWGSLYNQFKDKTYDTDKLEEETNLYLKFYND